MSVLENEARLIIETDEACSHPTYLPTYLPTLRADKVLLEVLPTQIRCWGGMHRLVSQSHLPTYLPTNLPTYLPTYPEGGQVLLEVLPTQIRRWGGMHRLIP